MSTACLVEIAAHLQRLLRTTETENDYSFYNAILGTFLGPVQDRYSPSAITVNDVCV